MTSVGDFLLAVKLPRHAHMAKLHEASGQYAAADATYQMLGDGLTRTQGAEHPDVATTVYQLGRLNLEQEFEHAPETEILYRTMGRLTWVNTFFSGALRIRRKALAADHRDVAESLYGMARLLCLTGQPKEATALLREAIEIQKKALGFHRDLALSLNALAGAQLSLSDLPGALRSFTAALEVHRRAAARHGRVDEAATLAKDADARLKASDSFHEGVAVLGKILETQQTYLSDAYFEMAFRIVGGVSRSPQILSMVLDLHRTLFVRESRAALLATLNGMADVHKALGDAKAALPYLKEAVEVQRLLA